MQTIVITGANKGIGFALAQKLGELGNTIILTARKNSEGQKALSELKSAGINCYFFKMDVILSEEIEATAAAINQQFGKIDVLINNAGMMHPEEGWIGNSTLTVREKALTKTFLTNFIGPWKVSKAFVPLLELSEAGQIVNVSAKIASLTLASDKKNPVYNSKPFAYNASKGALNQLTVHLAHALRRQKIKVVSIYPGWVQTDMGGEKATYTPLQAAQQISEIILNSAVVSGTFLDFEHELPW